MTMSDLERKEAQIQEVHVAEGPDKTSTRWPEVKFREKKPQTNHEKSETQRKRNSKNRLSNRRSTGIVFQEEIEAALALHNL